MAAQQPLSARVKPTSSGELGGVPAASCVNRGAAVDGDAGSPTVLLDLARPAAVVGRHGAAGCQHGGVGGSGRHRSLILHASTVDKPFACPHNRAYDPWHRQRMHSRVADVLRPRRITHLCLPSPG
jgi:hypothetical protein